MTLLAAAMMTLGSLFCLLAALGILRFPDLYTRLHAAAKAGPLGAGLILLGAGLASADPLIIVRCLLGLVFLIVIGPVSTHLLARAALRTSDAPASIASIEKLQDSR